MRKVFNWIVDKWLAGFLTATFYFLVKAYNDLPSTEKGHFFAFRWISSVVNYSIKLWLVVIVFLIIEIVRVVLKRLKGAYVAEKEDFIPENKSSNYKEDVFGRFKKKWRWSYRWSYSENSYLVIGAVPVCPTCDSSMEIKVSSFGFSSSSECPRCRLEGKPCIFDLSEDPDDIMKEVVRRANSQR